MKSITQVGEAIETYTDNIISPDDWTKRSVECYIEDNEQKSFENNESLHTMFQTLQEKYDLDTIIGDSVKHSLYLGDYFTLVLNLKEEIKTLLVEGDEEDNGEIPLIESSHCPSDRELIQEIVKEFSTNEEENDTLASNFRQTFTEYMSSFIEVNEDPKNLVKDTIKGIKHLKNAKVDIEQPYLSNGSRKDEKKKIEDVGDIRGSIIRQIEPDYVVKIHSDGRCFGYFYIEYSRECPEGGLPEARLCTGQLDCRIGYPCYGHA